jgi:hypothetical protein
MNRQVSKPQIFWAPDLSTARKIDDSDNHSDVRDHSCWH